MIILYRNLNVVGVKHYMQRIYVVILGMMILLYFTIVMLYALNTIPDIEEGLSPTLIKFAPTTLK